MKRIISLVLCVALSGCLFACSKQSGASKLPDSDFVDTKVTDNYVIDLYKDYAEIVEYSGKDEEVTVINEYESLPVMSIGDFAFKNLSTLKKVTIPSSVIRIGEYAFSSCRNLEEVVISNGVAEICCNAFEDNKKLKSVNIPDSVESIGAMAFFACDDLESVTIPKKIEKIGGGAFAYTKWVYGFENEFVFAGDGVLIAYIGGEDTVTVPEGTKHLSCFFENYDLKKVICNKDLETIEEMCFSDCGELKEIVLPDSLRTVGEKAFIWCQGLDKIELPSSLQKIEDEAFSDCIGLNSITIPAEVKTVGNLVFQRCDGLTQITFENPSTAISGNLFSEKNVDVTIHADAGSIIERYCTEHEYKFEATK